MYVFEMTDVDATLAAMQGLGLLWSKISKASKLIICHIYSNYLKLIQADINATMYLDYSRLLIQGKARYIFKIQFRWYIILDRPYMSGEGC